MSEAPERKPIDGGAVSLILSTWTLGILATTIGAIYADILAMVVGCGSLLVAIAATASVWSRRRSTTCMACEHNRPIETMEQLIEAIRKVPGLAEALPPEFTDRRTDFDELRERFWRAYLGLQQYPPVKKDPE